MRLHFVVMAFDSSCIIIDEKKILNGKNYLSAFLIQCSIITHFMLSVTKSHICI